MAEKATDQQIVNCVRNYRNESEQARLPRLEQNKINFDCYHLRQDWSHKQKGQSQEFLPKLAMAVEQSTTFLQEGLIDVGDWFKVYPQPGYVEEMMKISPKTIYMLTNQQLGKAGFINKVGEAAKLGLLGSLIIAKVGGKWIDKPIYRAVSKLKNGKFSKVLEKKTDKKWQLEISLIRQQDFHIDPKGRDLYKMQDIYMDYFQVERMAKGDDAIYDLEKVKLLQSQPPSQGSMQEAELQRETNLAPSNQMYRKQVKITEVWGTLIDDQGNVLHENVVTTIANDTIVIQEPTPNPNWHGEDPFVVTPIIAVPHSVWGKALMDAPAMLNLASNELFNLILDGALMSVHGIKQIRTNWLEDASQVENGISPGTTLEVNSSCPPGATVLERVDTSTVPQDGLNVLNIVNQEFNSASLTNDLRMGVASFRQVKATEVVEASQTITSMFSGMAKQIEGDEGSGLITRILMKAWKTIAQNVSNMDKNEIQGVLGETVTNKLLAMGPEEVFAETVMGCAFEVFGISATLNKQKDFTKMTALLQTIAGNEQLTEQFIQKYDFGKLLAEIMKALDINVYRIEADKEDGGDLSQSGQQGTGLGQGEAPDIQSQTPQAGAAGNQGDMSAQSAVQPGAPGPVAGTQFPGSRATSSLTR